jgi:hypothetical protein
MVADYRNICKLDGSRSEVEDPPPRADPSHAR